MFSKEFWDENSTHFNILDVMIIIFIVLVITSIYITDMTIRDVDQRALFTTNRNIIIW